VQPPRLAGALLLAWAGLMLCPPPAFAADEVAPGIRVVPGKTAAGSQPDGNSIVIDAPDGLIVIDTGRHAAHTQSVLNLARESKKPIRALINTHWHLDHVGGNALLRAAYPAVDVYATSAIDEALSGFLANYRKQLQSALSTAGGDGAHDRLRTEIALIDSGANLKPTRVVDRSSSVSIAGRTLEMHVERSAVTAGDIWVFDPQTKVLIAGDLVTLPAPFLDTACPERWRAALETLSRKPFNKLVPGHGAPMDPAAFDTYRSAFGRLLSCGNDRKQPKSACVDGWIRDSSSLVPESDREYGRALVDYYVENVFRADPAKRAVSAAGNPCPGTR
jgi:glyoxylase-like metal-dependent hydrolase (beta-lactamase superfamily II)